MRRWFYVEKFDIGICIPCKCGGTTFYNEVFLGGEGFGGEFRKQAIQIAQERGHGPWTAAKAASKLAGVRKVLAVREPIDRFMSLWRDKCAEDRAASGYNYYRGFSPEMLVQFILQWPFGDPHWTPQYSYMIPGAEVVDYRDIGKIFGYGNERRLNETDREIDVPLEIATVERLHDHYKQDRHLWTFREKGG